MAKHIAYYLSEAQIDRALAYAERIWEQKKFVRTVTIVERPAEKMCRPCDNCHSYKLCAEDGYECSHFRQWVNKGKYDEKHSTWK